MALPKSSRLVTCQKKLKKLLDEELRDIIVFGSLVKGGSAHDVDLALIVKEGADVSEKKKKVRNILGDKADIQVIDWKSIYSPLWLTLIKEGFSIKRGEFIHKLYSLKPQVLYKYSLVKLNPVQKVQFERGIKNVLGKEGKFLSRAVVLIPLEKKAAMMEFLKTWDVYYESQEYELLPVLRKEEFMS